MVVTGGSGDLGARVVRVLSGRGHDAVAASRRTGVDLSTGEGLDAALAGADAVVHAASSPTRPQTVDVAGAARIGASLRHLGSPAHVVSISIVGCDRVPYPYYRAKVDSETALERSGVPTTIVRATQFHPLAALLGSALRLGSTSFSLGDMRSQPVDIDWVAERLADHATGTAPSGFVRAPELAGPTAYGAREISALVAAHDGRTPPRVVRIPPVGEVMRGFSQGRNLPGPGAETGGRSFEDWLAAQPRPLPRRMHSPP
ncbi:nucleotide-diphosphate-sugar epimerase [Knoellia aerolata DSM 18566]|uniref:Nucleotide-diphosphate-sugar epimerase n=1 Tax=Knoellia aerolata DSM 18566 TaxID=1385519 RepID=A0A0A0K0W4_9MICO|nr:nucleotide-diphosphate-sugar epimerase [Knoellia aerolata DSM 18566]